MTLAVYNLRDRLEQVIQTNAVKVDSAEFLATHTPFTRLEFVGDGMSEGSAVTLTEEQYFQDEILDKRDSHQFQIVVGRNGAGKSHLIRWLKERYIREIPDLEKEEVLFISREESTLRGALEQIIQANVFAANAQKTEELRKLITAKDHLSDQELMTRILYEFAIAVEHGDEKEKAQLKTKTRRNLNAFLVDVKAREFLKQTNGPIERIKLRLANEEVGKRVDDVQPHFKAEDFVFDNDWIRDLKNDKDVSRRALNLAEDLFADYDLKLQAEVAAYLNQFLETVVQNCTNLRATDLKVIFEQLRRDLHAEGKNLTLFIEDITSFVGIDRAIVEVLITEHKGTDFCRLFSVVGITNDFYDNHFPPNMKDRVTGQVMINKASLFDEEAIAEMAARYLNAIYQDEDVFHQWVSNGGRDEDLPISTQYQHYRWAQHTLQNGRVMTLFPFNRRALNNMYNRLPSQTPRMFLKNVLLFMLLRYTSLAPDQQFPPEFKILGAQFDLPKWVDERSFQRLEQEFQPEQTHRLETLIRLWGDSTLTEQVVDGMKTVGGLEAEVFTSFGLTPPTGVQGSTPDKQITVTSTPVVDKPTTPRTTQITVTEPQTVVQVNDDSFDRIQKELEAWYNQTGQLASYAKSRELVYDAIKDFVDWETHGLSKSHLIYLEKGRIEFEGQAAKTKFADKLVFTRDRNLYYALLALHAFDLKGKKSWNFSGGHDHLLNLYKWLGKVEPQVIRFLQAPSSEDEWNMGEWSIQVAFYQRVLNGCIPKDNPSTIDLYFGLFQRAGEKVSEEPDRSGLWRTIQYNLAKEQTYLNEHQKMLLSLYNRNITQDGDSFYLNASTILTQIEKLRRNNWSLDSLPNTEIRDLNWYLPLRLLYMIRPHFQSALQQESDALKERLDKIKSWMGAENLQGTAEKLFQEAREFLALLVKGKLSYEEQKFQALTSNQLKSDTFAKLVKSAQQALSDTRWEETCLYHAQKPRAEIEPYLCLFEHLELLLDQLIGETSNRLNQFNQQSSPESVQEIIRKSREQITHAKNRLGDVHAGKEV